jgi:acyl-coenzyme A thioesterase PaaI-like protein
MRAERDEMTPIRRNKKEPRLAYEIALGIVIGGVTLWMLEAIAGLIAMQFALHQIKINFGG